MMNPRFFSVQRVRRYAAMFTAIAMLAGQFLPGGGLGEAQAHEISCEKTMGLERARCERHQLMFAKCGPIKGDAHFACDRDFIIATPLTCSALSGDDAVGCQAELAAVKTCMPQQGRAFMRCLRDSRVNAEGGTPPAAKP